MVCWDCGPPETDFVWSSYEANEWCKQHRRFRHINLSMYSMLLECENCGREVIEESLCFVRFELSRGKHLVSDRFTVCSWDCMRKIVENK